MVWVKQIRMAPKFKLLSFGNPILRIGFSMRWQNDSPDLVVEKIWPENGEVNLTAHTQSITVQFWSLDEAVDSEPLRRFADINKEELERSFLLSQISDVSQNPGRSTPSPHCRQNQVINWCKLILAICLQVYCPYDNTRNWGLSTSVEPRGLGRRARGRWDHMDPLTDEYKR